MAKRRPEADDLLRMAEHRRKMQALGRVAESAGRVAASGELRLLHPPAPTAIGGGAASGRGDLATDGSDEDGVVVSLAAVRARRAGHPAGSNLR